MNSCIDLMDEAGTHSYLLPSGLPVGKTLAVVEGREVEKLDAAELILFLSGLAVNLPERISAATCSFWSKGEKLPSSPASRLAYFAERVTQVSGRETVSMRVAGIERGHIRLSRSVELFAGEGPTWTYTMVPGESGEESAVTVLVLRWPDGYQTDAGLWFEKRDHADSIFDQINRKGERL